MTANNTTFCKPSLGEPYISSPKSLTDALEICFEQFGSSIAIDAPDFKMTYSELDGVTRHVASEFRKQFSIHQLKSSPIAISMSRSVEFYVAQIAVLRAGGFFLPIDPLQPAERIKFLLEDSSASLLLVRERDSFVMEESSLASFSMDANRLVKEYRDCAIQTSTPEVSADDWLEVSENDLAYMIYTSGSTGQPKGVQIAHRSICNLCRWWSEEFDLAPGERTLQMMSVGFDASLEEIFPTLTTGGTLIPIQPEAFNSMEQFLDFIGRERIHNLHFPTAFWHALTASFETHPALELPDSVRTVVLGGEKIDSTLVDVWFAKVGTEIRLTNAYGPTEATVAASYAILGPGVKPSIGKPIHGVSFCVCNPEGQAVGTGQSGELYIGGIGVATEYWQREKLTAEKFVQSPLNDGLLYYRTGDIAKLNEDGNYEYVGRIDDQVKLRGYRIEPGEISACLGTHPQISQAHVVARQLSNESGAQHLVGYIVVKSEDGYSESELRAFLGQRLPAYMIPTRIVVMEAFPITAGGKLDLSKFPNPTGDIDSGSALGESQLLTRTEQKIGKLWEKVLGVGQLSRESNFFQIGGDSLSAMRLVLLLESEFPGAVIPVAVLIPNPTIAAMADYVDRRHHALPATTSQNWPLLTRLDDTQQPIGIVCIHAAGGGGMFYRQLFEGVEQAAATAVLESAILYQEEPGDLEQLNIKDLAQDYVDCLIDAGCQQKLTLVGYSFGSLMAIEMAQLLEARGHVVEKIINIDCPNPLKAKPRNRLSKYWCRIQSYETFRERIDAYKRIKQRKRKVNELKKSEEANLPAPVELRPLRLELVFSALAEKYEPEPMSIPMHLIRGKYPLPIYRIPADYGWSEMVSDLTIVQILGGHNTIFYDPYLKSLIEAFHDALGK